jgi:hypothetical protein
LNAKAQSSKAVKKNPRSGLRKQRRRLGIFVELKLKTDQAAEQRKKAAHGANRGI